MPSLRDLVLRNRSYRRFDESHRIERETLLELVGLARCTASATNRQPLKYLLSADPETNERIFPCLFWAAFLQDWKGPAPGERPTAYIVVLIDETLTKDWWCDDGIALQTMLLGAVEKDLGGCIIGSQHSGCRTLCESASVEDMRLLEACPQDCVDVDDACLLRFVQAVQD